MLPHELWLSPWGIMAWGATPKSSRIQSGEMSHLAKAHEMEPGVLVDDVAGQVARR